MSDLIERQAAIDVLDVLCQEHRYRIPGKSETYRPYNEAWQDALDRAECAIGKLPSAQPETHDKRMETHACDSISRQAAMEEISKQQTYKMFEGEDTLYLDANDVGSVLASLPSVQPDLEEAYICGETEAEARFHAQQRWIPCSERLPEKEEQVLIYAWNVHYVLAKYREIRTCDGVYKMAWVTEDAYSAPREIKHEVICWMPLPEPYRKENR